MSYFYPFPGQRSVPVNSNIQFKIGDTGAGTGIDLSSFKVLINDINIKNCESYLTEFGNYYLFDYIPKNIDQNKWVSVKVQCMDSVINRLDTTYTYLTGISSIIDSCKRIIYPGGSTITNPANKVRVEFPEGAVGDTLYFTIGETDTIPPLPDSTVAISKYYYLGPPGLQLNKKITVSVPYRL